MQRMIKEDHLTYNLRFIMLRNFICAVIENLRKNFTISLKLTLRHFCRRRIFKSRRRSKKPKRKRSWKKNKKQKKRLIKKKKIKIDFINIFKVNCMILIIKCVQVRMIF
jgi:hypothetical protein